jgi:hypothetical protein
MPAPHRRPRATSGGIEVLADAAYWKIFVHASMLIQFPEKAWNRTIGEPWLESDNDL